MPKQNLKFADDFAPDYDNSVLQDNWIGPELIFNLTENLLQAKSKILDLGIGTGESTIRFQEKGHEICGLDGSEKMLEQCKTKNIGSTLIHHDLEISPYPLETNQFDAIISNGVFHLIHPLKLVFSEVKRILKPGGIFAFTFENTENISGSKEIEYGIWEKKSATGIFTYKHNSSYIRNLLRQHNFRTLEEKQFLAFRNKKSGTEFYFNAIVARLQPSQ